MAVSRRTVVTGLVSTPVVLGLGCAKNEASDSGGHRMDGTDGTDGTDVKD